MIVNRSDLQHNNFGKDYESGYRIVYLYPDNYRVGEYCKTVDGFMIGFAKSYPIIDEEDIPNFISTKDLLNRYLEEIQDILGVAIYDVNGKCIDKVYR